MNKNDIDMTDDLLEGETLRDEEFYEDGEIIVGLDIGTTKICCIVGMVLEHGVRILGVGIAPSQGMKRGVVVNIESTVASIRRAVEIAEKDADIDLSGHAVYVGIAGNHIRGEKSSGMLIVDREIRPADISAVIAAASRVKIPENQQIIHVMEQEFSVDNQTGIQNPVGMAALRLSTDVHIVTADNAAVHNVVACCQQAGFEVRQLVLESIASSHAVLSKDEMELGVALIDIGGGTSDLAIFYDGTIRYTSEVSLGGHNLTSDVSVSLRTPLQNAEQLKEDFGGAISGAIKSNYVIDVATVGAQEPMKIPQRTLVEILEARMVEIFEILNEQLIQSDYKYKLHGGVVLTGGTSLLVNITELAEQVFELPVRLGEPTGISGKTSMLQDPRCTTGVGLVLYGKSRREDSGQQDEGMWARIKAWFANLL